jgi:hypothetical protein
MDADHAGGASRPYTTRGFSIIDGRHSAGVLPARPVGDEQPHTRRQDAPRGSGRASATKSQQINYRKLSDEQILDL